MKTAAKLILVLLLGVNVSSVTFADEETGLEQPISQPGAGTDEPCRRAIEQSALLNGGELFEAAEACARVEEADDAVFLMLVGQVRALTDMSLLEPASVADQTTVGELYGALYYKYGGSGPDELFRNAVRATAMFERLGTWRPDFSEHYSPGWRYRSPSGGDVYQLMADHSMDVRLAKLERYRNLLEDDRYYAVHRERQELLARNNNRIVAGTDDADRIGELDELADAISGSIPLVPVPEPPRELLLYTAPNAGAPLEEIDTSD